MFWTQDEEPAAFAVPDEVVDLLFALDCRHLPVDHSYALGRALSEALPWLVEGSGVGIHEIHVAGSQNGWQRPARAEGNLLQLSRRTKLRVRAPKEMVDRLLTELPGRTLDVGGCRLGIGAGKQKALIPETTLFARHVVGDEREDEMSFLQRCANDLAALEVRMPKALCGKPTRLATVEGSIHTRSLMIADLTLAESIRLQQRGLGAHRLLGCGIFIPHKDIKAVGSSY